MAGEIKTTIGWLEMVNYTANPTDGDSNLRGLAFVAGSLKYWNGTTFVAVGGSGGASTWDELYDNDKTLTIDDTTLTFQVTKAGINGLTLAGNATASGAILAFSNSGSGNDVTGTSSTWSVTKAGAATFASVIAESITAAANLAIDATGTGTITIGGTSTGAVTIGPALTATASVTITGGADSNVFTITAGDMLMSNGKIAVTNDDTDAILTATANSVTTGNVILVTANGVTSGTILNLVTTSAGFSGGSFIACNDGGVRMSVGVDGATKIATAVNSTKALEITGIQTSENLVTLTSSGVTADDKAIILINSSGNSASGSNQIRIAPSGTPVDGSIGIEFVGSGKLMQAMYIDGDSVDNSVVVINGGGALASGKSVLQVTADGEPAAGAIFTQFDFSGATMTNNPIGVQIKTAGSTGASLDIVSTAATATGVVTITNNSLTTGTGLLVTSSGTMTTTGELVSLVGNSATTCTGLLRISGTGLTDGFAIQVTGGGANATASGGVVDIVAGAAIAGSALRVTTTGVYTGTTGVVDINASSATTGTIVDINAAGLTSGSALQISATEATLTTGLYIQCYDGAANDFTVAKYGATTIAGNAATNVFTINAGNEVITAGNLILTAGTIIETAQAISNANTAISVTHGVTKIANDGASTHAMADGVEGQRKTIVCTVYAGDAVITPSNLANGTTITLNAVNDACDMIFLGTEWFVVNLYGTAAVA